MKQAKIKQVLVKVTFFVAVDIINEEKFKKTIKAFEKRVPASQINYCEITK